MEVTAFAGVPSTFCILIKKAGLKSQKIPTLRLVTQAGGGMAPALQQELVDAIAPARLFVMYGTTEASPRLTYVEPEVLPRKWGSIGKAIPGVEVIVADKNGNRLPPGVQGEIAARGPNIMMGYWKSPASTAEVVRNGYYFTGDLGYEDEDGYFFLTGRERDIIKPGGNRVSSKEIEDMVMQFPGILETAAIGVPDDILGEAIKVYLVPQAASFPVEQLKQYLEMQLPFFKRPHHYETRRCLPKNESGKILKSKLREERHSQFLTV
jgi:long-chain acyl-CoA synthetase